MVQRVLGDFRVVAERAQHLLLAFQFLQQVRFQVRAAGDFHDLEQGQQRDVMVLGLRLADEIARARKQILQAQESPYTFVKRVLVGDHDRAVV